MSTYKKIELEKVTNIAGEKEVGERFVWSYTTSNDEVARQRAWRALKRDHPNENPMDWKLVG
jgi:hypothetical protein